MKLSIHVLALVALVAMVCGHDDCDATSHLTTKARVTKVTEVTAASKAGPLISEFRPHQPELPPGQQQVEIFGTPLANFDGCIWIIDAMGGSGVTGNVYDEISVSGTFDSNGLLVVDIFDLEDRNINSVSFTIFLSASCPGVFKDVLDPTEAQEIIDDAEPIYDSIGVPGTANDQRFLEEIRTALDSLGTFPGIDLTYPGERLELVFRDASDGEVYSVTKFGDGPVYDTNGNELIADDFDPSPFDSTFGAINPTRGSAVVGDPHIHTLKGDHYTLLREGSFLLWHFGLEQPNVEWQIFAHYSGRQSFTKGLLLVDTSGPQPSKMEIMTVSMADPWCQGQPR